MIMMRLTYSVFLWHYRQGIIDLIHIWMNFLALVYRVFSLPDLLRTLFYPWRRIAEPYKRGPGFSLEQFAGAVVVNIMMRIIGFFARSIFIVLSLFFLALVFLVGLIILFIWIFMPIVLVGSFAFGIALLFS